MNALRAAGLVYDADHDAAVQAMVDQSLLLGMDCGPGGITIRATKAREIAAQLAFAAREYLDEHPGVENYVDEQVIDRSTDGRYVVIFTKPRGRTPHELRRLAEARLAAVLGVDLAAIFLDHRRASIDVHVAGGGFAATCLCGALTGPFRRGQTGCTETRTDHERHVSEVVGQAFTHAVHEAGHAVVATLTGWPVRYLTLAPRHEMADGRCAGASVSMSQPKAARASSRTPLWEADR